MKFWGAGYNIDVNVTNWTQLESQLVDKFVDGKGFALATINLDHLVKLRSDQIFQTAYGQQDIVVADGNPIVWLSNLAGRPVDLIPGSDSVMPLLALAEKHGKKIAFFGSTAESLDAAQKFIQEKLPRLDICAKISPPFGFDPQGSQARDMLESVRESGADMVFIALGAPKQEIFAAFGRSVLPDVGFVSIGASLDFFAGSQKRAPAWVRKIAMEWLWRALSNPTRLVPRYAKCIAILPQEVIHALRLRRNQVSVNQA